MLRELIKSSNGLVVPGAGSPLEARIISAAGFKAMYVSGYAVAGFMYGKPDIGLVGLEGLVETVRRIRAVTDIPMIVDADTAYGDVSNVLDTVRALEAAGANAIQIEDQKWPKRCGHLAGKQVVSREEATRKIAAAAEARRNPETIIIARTDAVSPLGLDEGLERVQDFEAAGADWTFVDAPPGRDAMTQVGRTGNVPRVANMSESGRTPILPKQELVDLGFEVILYPTSTLRAMSSIGRELMSHLSEHETTLDSKVNIDSLDTFNELVQIDKYFRFEKPFTEATIE